MAFATAFLVAFTVFALAVPAAMVAVLVYAAPGRTRRTTQQPTRLSARAAEPVVAVQKAAA